MKYNIKNILTAAALLLTTSVWAQDGAADKFTVKYQLDGTQSTAEAAGTVTGSISGTTGTLTVTPVDGNYITKDQIKVVKTILGNEAQSRTRTPDISTPVEITATNASADPSGVTTYTFTVTDDTYDYEVTANFLTRTDIGSMTVTTDESSYTYTGQAIEPVVTVKLTTDAALTAGTDYTVEYANNINVPASDNDPKPTITITGIGIYKGTKSVNFTIAKADAAIETAPTAVTGLTYTGEAQGLVNGGKGNGGELQYKLGADGTYGTTLPSATNSGTYTVYYKVVGDANHNDTEEESLEVTIGQTGGAISYAAASVNKTYGDEPFINTLSITGDGTVSYASSNTEVATVNASTGEVTIVGNGEATITATVADGTNYTYETKTASYLLSVGTEAMEVTAEGFTGTYDGKAHGISVTAPEDATIAYGTTEGTYNLTACPTYTNAGTYTVFYQVTKPNFTTISGSQTVIINKAAGTITFAEESINKTFGDEAFTYEPTITGDGTVSYASSDTNVATVDAETGEVTLVGTGEATITATVADGTNYTYDTKTASYLLSVDTQAMEVTAEGFTGTYDGEAHGINVTAPEDATIVYGTTEGTYDLEDCPTYTQAGTYTVFYQVTKPNFTTVSGSQTVIINKAAGTITFAEESVSKTVGDESFTNELTITGDGTVSYASSDIEVATVNAETGEVTLVGDGEAKITATVADGTNYTYETKTASYLLSVGTKTEAMEVSVEGFTDTYDGEAHGITVKAPEDATIAYGITEGTYDLEDCPTYTQAGTYTVFYQVTKDGYETVTGSAEVVIRKAIPTVTDPIAKEGLIYNGEAQELIYAGSTTGGEMQYSLDNYYYSTTIPTGTEVNDYTVYYRVVGGTNYEDVAVASLIVTINKVPTEYYPLWVNDTQVTSNNVEDILGHDKNSERPLYIYNHKDQTLLVNQDLLGTTVIKSGLSDLQVYLIEANKIKSIEFDNQGEEGNTGKLTFTCNGNHPGRLVIENTKGNSVITGFSEIDYKWELTLMEPESAFYDETAHQMMYKDKNNDTQIADSVTIGQVIIPTGEIVGLRNPALKVAAIKFNNYSYSPTADPTKSKILITLNPSNPDVDDDYVDDDGEPGIVIGSTMKDSQAGRVANLVANNELVPGGSKFAEDFDGFTFMVPAGSGTIIIDQEVDAGFEFHLRIGTGAPITLAEGFSGRAEAREPYSVTTPTYCYLYLVEKEGGAARGVTPIGKREKAHGKVTAIGVSVSNINSTNPPSEASGGVLSEEDDPEIIIDDTDGIKEIIYTDRDRVGNNRWYNLEGQQIDEPTKKGLYIYNRKKIYIK